MILQVLIYNIFKFILIMYLFKFHIHKAIKIFFLSFMKYLFINFKFDINN